MPRQRFATLAIAALLCARPVEAATSMRVDVPVRGKTVAVTVYRPAGLPKGTILMGSGDVGWVGLAVDLAETLADRGYLVAGINVRQYLGAFTSGKQHLTAGEPAADYRAICDVLAERHWLARPVIVSGVSEGAALAVLAAGPANHDLFDGVITMGVPAVAELAWRWTDFTAWITKKDAHEPSFAPFDYIAAVSPVPVAMIQSRQDEYVPEGDYTKYFSLAHEPKKVVLIDASNHRFTDALPRLREEYWPAWPGSRRCTPPRGAGDDGPDLYARLVPRRSGRSGTAPRSGSSPSSPSSWRCRGTRCGRSTPVISAPRYTRLDHLARHRCRGNGAQCRGHGSLRRGRVPAHPDPRGGALALWRGGVRVEQLPDARAGRGAGDPALALPGSASILVGELHSGVVSIALAFTSGLAGWVARRRGRRPAAAMPGAVARRHAGAGVSAALACDRAAVRVGSHGTESRLARRVARWRSSAGSTGCWRGVAFLACMRATGAGATRGY